MVGSIEIAIPNADEWINQSLKISLFYAYYCFHFPTLLLVLLFTGLLCGLWKYS